MPVSSSCVSLLAHLDRAAVRVHASGRPACSGTGRARPRRRRRRCPPGSPSCPRWHPWACSSHLSRPSSTPSPSVSIGQPFASTLAPCAVLSQHCRCHPARRRRRSPSGSPSCPRARPWACRRTCRGRRTRRRRRCRSGSPRASTLAPMRRVGALVEPVAHAVEILVLALAADHDHCSPMVVDDVIGVKSVAFASRNITSRTCSRRYRRSRFITLMSTPSAEARAQPRAADEQQVFVLRAAEAEAGEDVRRHLLRGVAQAPAQVQRRVHVKV